MASLSIAELDAQFESEPFARVVSELRLQPGGVDPLGLRQVNLDLMDWALPGINNVTTLIRPYVLMAWAWWKAARAAEARGSTTVSAESLRNTVDRIETIFIWSHFLVGQGQGLPGRQVLGRSLPEVGETKPYSFSGKQWDKLRNERRTNTSLMSAVQYGPSIRVLEGIGWLAPAEKGTFVPVGDVMKAVETFDKLVSPHLPAMLLARGGGPLTAKAAAELHAIWPTSKPTIAEKKAFQDTFFNRGEGARLESREHRRRSTLQLIYAVLAAVNKPIEIAAIRRMMLSGRTPSKKRIKLAEDLVPVQRCWIALQARQLQRLGLEALLVWIERHIADAGGTADANSMCVEANRLVQLSGGTSYSNVRSFRSAISNLAKPYGWPAAAGLGGKADIFRLMDQIVLAQQNGDHAELPRLSLDAIGIAAAITDELRALGERDGPEDLIGGSQDRLPLGLASVRLGGLSEASMLDLWREILESWVLAQHVRWSVARSGDETQRLRLAVDEGGWVRLRSKLSGPFRPTPDRLFTALSLSADCGLLKRANQDEPLYGLP